MFNTRPRSHCQADTAGATATQQRTWMRPCSSQVSLPLETSLPGLSVKQRRQLATAVQSMNNTTGRATGSINWLKPQTQTEIMHHSTCDSGECVVNNRAAQQQGTRPFHTQLQCARYIYGVPPQKQAMCQQRTEPQALPEVATVTVGGHTPHTKVGWSGFHTHTHTGVMVSETLSLPGCGTHPTANYQHEHLSHMTAASKSAPGSLALFTAEKSPSCTTQSI